MTLSNADLSIIEASERGYYALKGKVYSKNKELYLYKSKSGYLKFGIRKRNKKVVFMHLHRLVAYQKYGNDLFKEGIQVRHLDGDPTNNTENNIAIGTAFDNCHDKDPGTRRRVAIIASSFMQKHNHKVIVELHKKGKSYREIMDDLGISSKGTVSFIIKKSMQATELT